MVRGCRSARVGVVWVVGVVGSKRLGDVGFEDDVMGRRDETGYRDDTQHTVQ